MRRKTPGAGRGGVTLVEVLVAIFVVALGLMALLTLFPLGALSMAQSIKDDRTAGVSYNMNSVARAYWKYNLESISTTATDYESALNDPTNGALVNPAAAGGPLPKLVAGYVGSSYPVYVDYWGSNMYQGTAYAQWLAGQQDGMPRRTPGAPFALNGANPWTKNLIALSLYSGLDDLTFDQTGTPGAVPQRAGQYSAALVYRRSDWTESRFVDVTVVVYSGRSLQFGADLTPAGENAYLTGPNPSNAAQGFVQGSNVVELQYGATRPNLRRGEWIMDAQMVDAQGNPKPHGYFYRVVNVTDVNSTTLELELQTAAKDFTAANSKILVLDNVVEVFDKPTMGP
jgi:hypothetical protein